VIIKFFVTENLYSIIISVSRLIVSLLPKIFFSISAREKLKIDLIFLQRGSLRSTDEAKYNRVNQRIIIHEASHVSIYRSKKSCLRRCRDLRVRLKNLLNLTHVIKFHTSQTVQIFDNSTRDEYVRK